MILNEKRDSLAEYAGLPVSVNAGILRWGSALLNGETIYSLMLKDVIINDVPRSDIDHIWLRLGKTGSSRVYKHLNNIYQMRCSLSAVVTPYTRDNGEQSYGLAMANEVRLHSATKTYLLNKRSEVVHSDDYGQKEVRTIRHILHDRAYEAQREVMEALAKAESLPGHLYRAVNRYFHSKELATPGEIKEARTFLEAICT